MKGLMVITSHDQLGNTGERLDSGSKSLPGIRHPKAAPGILRQMSPSVRSNSSADASERPADTERNYDKWNFSGSNGGVDR